MNGPVLGPLFLLTEGCSPASLQKGLGIELAENVDQAGDDPGPTRLMAGADPGTVIAVEVLVKQDVIPPVRVRLELFRAAINWPAFRECFLQRP